MAVAAGFNHSAAITEDGRRLVWGDGDDGQLGNNDVDSFLDAPELLENFVPPDQFRNSPLVMVAAGSSHTCACTEDGGLWVWGGEF